MTKKYYFEEKRDVAFWMLVDYFRGARLTQEVVLKKASEIVYKVFGKKNKIEIISIFTKYVSRYGFDANKN